MCGRFTLKTPVETIKTLFPDMRMRDVGPRYNIAPTQLVLGIRHDASNTKELVEFRWGLIPFWAKDSKLAAKMINARSETVHEKPAFRAAYKKRRCLIVADGYYEWKKIGDQKQPFYFTPNANSDSFCMAGLWETWHDRINDQTVESCTILTTNSNSRLAEF
ncbi:MAG: SOS response-associated peptidase, partial [Planctomycetota bacterium]